MGRRHSWKVGITSQGRNSLGGTALQPTSVLIRPSLKSTPFNCCGSVQVGTWGVPVMGPSADSIPATRQHKGSMSPHSAQRNLTSLPLALDQIDYFHCSTAFVESHLASRHLSHTLHTLHVHYKQVDTRCGMLTATQCRRWLQLSPNNDY